jgi:hypothetical protein
MHTPNVAKVECWVSNVVALSAWMSALTLAMGMTQSRISMILLRELPVTPMFLRKLAKACAWSRSGSPA